MKKHLFARTVLSGLFVAFCAIGFIFFQGCQKQDYDDEDFLDPALSQSSELEEYMIAGMEYRHALTVFQEAMNKIDFSKLEFTEESDGTKVMRLPVSIDLDSKARIVDEKKQSLLAKYPQFASLPEGKKMDYFQYCLKNSVNVNCKLLELGICIGTPRTKGGYTESFKNEKEYMAYLADWMQKDDYKECIIIIFKDGTAITVHDDAFTPTQAVIPSLGYTNDFSKYYYNGKEINFVAHTHKNSPVATGDDKKNPDKNLHGLQQALYYNGGFTSEFKADAPPPPVNPSL